MEDFELEPARDFGMTLSQSFKSLQRESGLVATGLHFAWWTAVRAYLAVWHRLAIHGQANLPKKPPFVLVANHASHLDAFVLAAALPWRWRDQVFPIAAGDVFFETPIMTTFAAMFLNALPMWRKKCGPHALQQLRERLLREECVYILFPEGGRSRDGRMMPFKKGLGMLVAETNVPVVPCFLHGTFEALRPERTVPKPRKINLTIGRPMAFFEVSNTRPGWEKCVADLEQAVTELEASCAECRYERSRVK